MARKITSLYSRVSHGVSGLCCICNLGRTTSFFYFHKKQSMYELRIFTLTNHIVTKSNKTRLVLIGLRICDHLWFVFPFWSKNQSSQFMEYLGTYAVLCIRFTKLKKHCPDLFLEIIFHLNYVLDYEYSTSFIWGLYQVWIVISCWDCFSNVI